MQNAVLIGWLQALLPCKETTGNLSSISSSSLRLVRKFSDQTLWSLCHQMFIRLVCLLVVQIILNGLPLYMLSQETQGSHRLLSTLMHRSSYQLRLIWDRSRLHWKSVSRPLRVRCSPFRVRSNVGRAWRCSCKHRSSGAHTSMRKLW